MDRAQVAIDLGTAVVKSACGMWAGPLGGPASKVADLIRDRVADKLKQRRAERFFQQCADVVAEKLLRVIEAQGTQLAEHELEAAVNAVRDTFETSALTRADLVRVDLDARLVERSLEAAREAVLARALLDEGGRAAYDLLLREACSYAVEIVSTLPEFDRTAFTELLRRDTAILETLQTVLSRLPDRESVDDFEADYRRLLIQRLDRLSLFGARLSVRAGRRYPLSVAYVSLGASTNVGPSDWRRTTLEAIQHSVPLAGRPDDEQLQLRSLVTTDTVKDMQEAAERAWDQMAKSERGRGSLQLLSREDWLRALPDNLVFFPADEEFINNSVLMNPLSYSSTRRIFLSWLSTAGDVPVERFLHRGRRLLLTGDAGSGKSTFLQWLAVRAAHRDFEESLQDWNEVVPFFISLRRYADQPLPSAEQFTETVSRHIGAEMPKGWVQGLLRAGRAVVLVDGLDELQEGPSRQGALDWLTDLVAEFPASRYVVSTRPAAVQQLAASALPEGFVPLELRPMSSAKMRLFVEQWHDAMSVEVADQDQRERLATDKSALLAALEHDRHLRALCINPLLCALICALNHERHGHLPRHRVGVYAGALEMLVDARDRERGVRDALELSYEQKITLLQDLALYLVRNSWSEVAAERAQEQLSRSLRTLNHAETNGADVLRHLVERSGLLRSPSEGRVQFVHRSFQEYLAGKALVDGDEIGYLLERARDDQFRDVIIMALGYAAPRQAQEFLRGLVDLVTGPKGLRGALAAVRQGRPEPAETERLKLLAVACLQVALRVDPEVRHRIEDLARELLPPTSFEVVPFFSSAGEIVLDLLGERPPVTAQQAAVAIRICTSIGGRDAMALIARFANGHREVEDEVIRAWTQFDLREFSEEVFPHLTWSGSLTVTDRTLVPYLRGLPGLRSLTLPADLLPVEGLAGPPGQVRFLKVAKDSSRRIARIAQWEEITHLEIQLDRLDADLSRLHRLTRCQALRILSDDFRPANVTALAKLPALQMLQLATPAASFIKVDGLAGRKGLVVHVPPKVAVMGWNTLQGDPRVVVSEEFPVLFDPV